MSFVPSLIESGSIIFFPFALDTLSISSESSASNIVFSLSSSLFSLLSSISLSDVIVIVRSFECFSPCLSASSFNGTEMVLFSSSRTTPATVPLSETMYLVPEIISFKVFAQARIKATKTIIMMVFLFSFAATKSPNDLASFLILTPEFLIRIPYPI